jgi:hypothetical protein
MCSQLPRWIKIYNRSFTPRPVAADPANISDHEAEAQCYILSRTDESEQKFLKDEKASTAAECFKKLRMRHTGESAVILYQVFSKIFSMNMWRTSESEVISSMTTVQNLATRIFQLGTLDAGTLAAVGTIHLPDDGSDAVKLKLLDDIFVGTLWLRFTLEQVKLEVRSVTPLASLPRSCLLPPVLEDSSVVTCEERVE